MRFVICVLIPLFAPAQAYSGELAAWLRGDQLIPSCTFPRGKCGYLDRKGEIVIPPRYDGAGRFQRNRAIVAMGGKFGAIGPDGTEHVPIIFDQIFGFMSPDETTFRLGAIHGFVDRFGNWSFAKSDNEWKRRFLAHSKAQPDPSFVRSNHWVVGAHYLPSHRQHCLHEYSHLEVDGRIAVLGSSATRINDATYVSAVFACGEPVRVAPNTYEVGFLDTRGNPILGRYFKQVYGFHNGVAVVEMRGAIAIIDTEGRYLLPPVKSDVRAFELISGPVYLSLPDGALLVTKALARNLARDPSRLWIGSPHTHLCKDSMMWIVEDDGEFTFRDVTGDNFLGRGFDFATCFDGGAARVALPERREWCLIDNTGRVDDASCEKNHQFIIYEFGDGPPKVSGRDLYEKSLKQAWIEMAGKWRR